MSVMIMVKNNGAIFLLHLSHLTQFQKQNKQQKKQFFCIANFKAAISFWQMLKWPLNRVWHLTIMCHFCVYVFISVENGLSGLKTVNKMRLCFWDSIQYTVAAATADECVIWQTVLLLKPIFSLYHLESFISFSLSEHVSCVDTSFKFYSHINLNTFNRRLLFHTCQINVISSVNHTLYMCVYTIFNFISNHLRLTLFIELLYDIGSSTQKTTTTIFDIV